MSWISDADLADVEMLAASGRAIPALLVKAVIARLRDSEQKLAAHSPSRQPGTGHDPSGSVHRAGRPQHHVHARPTLEEA